ncbi:hypothetical protein [Fusobacterium polymorphum]|uniref:hypothetical protein n=1 Tax=Fusobacterium nucleatum subsp. polymorphum TaxID=76857 RepID=UPI003008C167
MSYFEGLKLTKKGEQLQAKINGNLSETLTFTKAKLGSGAITSNDEIRFLTDVKEVWGTANVTSCKIQGDEKNIVAIELQFSNAELREDKIFREIGLYAQGNEGEEILYAYANAGDKYDYIPLMKDSPHSFIIVIYFNITSGSKVDAKIDLHSYVSLQEFNEGMNKKVNKTDYASAEQYGIVKYGAEEGTVLEGNKFTQMMGKDYGGILNEPGLKTSGKAYWDNNTRKLYICKNNNSDISPNINNYIPFDNGSILERLENLFKVENKDVTSRVTNCKNATLRKMKIDRLCIMQFTISSEVSANINNKCSIYFDEPFKDIPFISVTDNNAGASGATSPSVDWGTTTQITVSNFEGAFTLMATGYI